ncbi:MAG: NAD-dependent epimerase/dehydratase family protein [Thermoplasmatales archaeon]|nr:NAD-dependent epimerase/dehydratase family protein [Thermoplasmatales archaeon]
MELEGKTIFVTGATGFIGRNTVNAFLDGNVKQIRVLTRCRRNEKWLNNDKIKIIKGNIQNLNDVKKGMRNSEIVIHLAAHANVTESTKKPLFSFNTTAMGTMNTLKTAVDINIRKFIYLSSARVYGDPVYRPVDEKHPLNPKTVYGGSKLAGEIMTNVFHATYGLDTTVLRAFSVYGPWRFPKKHTLSGVIPLFVDKALRGKPITIVGDGNQTKDFVNVKDVIHAMLLSTKKDTAGEVFNIGTGIATSINKLADTVINFTHSDSEIIYIPSEKESVSNVADISKARKCLGYKPQVSLKDGLTEYIQWYNSWRKK